MTANQREPNLATAVLWLALAACAALMLLGGINFLAHLGGDDSAPPAPAVTETITVHKPSAAPARTGTPLVDEDAFRSPVPSVCTTSAVSRTDWSPCGQLLGYFDEETPGPSATMAP
ncbi:hypothetical protein [Streptomyces sp. NPDC006638]|uniref:hypothetical protein n=1 Tax=Streptomyces sp. NPDC006638 TaxID=3157183 RepID=UPI0033BD1D96